MIALLSLAAWILSWLLVVGTLPATLLLIVLTFAGVALHKRKIGKRIGNLRICALVPAHNEEFLIARTVKSLLASGGKDFAVYVIADNCTDSTAEVAAAAGARVLVRANMSQRGKGYALNFGFERVLADGYEGVLVADADSVVSRNLVQTVTEYLTAGADAVQCRYRVLGKDLTVRSRLMDLAFLGFNVLRPLGRDRLGLSAGILGNGFALTADTLRAVPYRAGSIVEDLEYHIYLIRAGRRVRFADEATVYGEIPGGGAEASSQRSRWEGGRLRMLREWAPRLARDLAHGNLACFEPLVEVLVPPLGYQALLLVILFTIGSGTFKWWAVMQTAVMGFHVVAAASRGENFPGNLEIFLAVPFYIFWKVTQLPRIARASRPETVWARTGRRD